MEEKVKALSKQLEEKKKEDELSDLKRIKREARDEAAKGVLANLDVLHQKLVLLESTASKINHKSKSEIAMVLACFQANKTVPAFAAKLVLKLLSTKEEEAILDKEQNLFKQFAMAPMPRAWHPDMYSSGAAFGPHIMQPPFSPWNRPQGLARPRMTQARGNGLCFRCKRPGHQIRDCPN